MVQVNNPAGKKIKEVLTQEKEIEEALGNSEYNVEEVQRDLIDFTVLNRGGLETAAHLAGVPVDKAVQHFVQQNNLDDLNNEEIHQLSQGKRYGITDSINAMIPVAGARKEHQVFGEVVQKYLKEWENPEEIEREIPSLPSTVEDVLTQAGINYKTGESAINQHGVDESFGLIDGSYVSDSTEFSMEDYILGFLSETRNIDEVAEGINELIGSDVVTGQEVGSYLSEVDFAFYSSPGNYNLDRQVLSYEDLPEVTLELVKSQH